MWNNTTRSQLKPKFNKVVEKPVDLKQISSSKPSGIDYILPGGLSGFSEFGPDISEITYFTVLRVLSSAVGKMPCHIRDENNKIVKNKAEKLLTIRPNDAMTPCQLLTYLEYCRNHYGNGYAYVKWSENTGELKSITALNPLQVRLWVDDVSEDIVQKYYYSYTTMNGSTYLIMPEDMIHLKNWYIEDRSRLIGVPVRDVLRQYMTASQAAQETQTNLYRNGMFGGVLNYVADMSEAQQEVMLDRIKRIGMKNKIVPLPQGWELKPINLSLQDQQFLEGRRMTAQSLAAAFGVSPNQINDYSKGSYANATAQELQFLTSVLYSVARMYEDEMTYKLLSSKDVENGYRVDFDTEAVLQNTPDVLADILTKYVTGSIMTINEARQKANLPPLPDCDKLMTMPGATTLEKEVVTV